MNQQTLQLIIKAQDQATSVLRSVEKSLENVEKSSDKLAKSTISDNDKIVASHRKNKEILKQMEGAYTAMSLVAVGAVATIGVAILKNAANYQQEISNIKALTQITGKELQEVEQVIKQANITTQFSSIEAAQGMQELLKAGLNITDAKTGLKAALDLAAAGNISVKEAAELASVALNAFKKDNLSVAQAADILAGAANASATDIGELKFGLQMVSAVASGVGLSFKDTASALAVFAQNGLKGSDAGTSLKTMLMNLQPSTDAQSALFEELGIITTKTTSKFIENTKVTAKNADKIKELNQRIQELTKEGIEKSGVAINRNQDKIKNYTDKINDLNSRIQNLTQKQGEFNNKTKQSTINSVANQIEKAKDQIAG